jgi:hypothetical protein
MQEYLPFKSSPELLDEYIFSDGKIRTGKLLEGMHQCYIRNSTRFHLMRFHLALTYLISRN